MLKPKTFLSLLPIVLFFAGCNSLNPFTTPAVYIPPTLATTPLPLETPLPTPLSVTPTPSCTNSLTYLEDLTLPDGTNVTPGEILDKRWQVKNDGTCNWESGYTLRLITGPDMGAKPEQALYPARADTETTLRILYTAPAESGIYRSAWQAYDPSGQAFGDPIFIEIVVP
ncbi:MAG: hypothetical protein H6636_12930 [Anaerolineales bacterium]|nr:hypothetical protein [Anaerolineales bacterium]